MVRVGEMHVEIVTERLPGPSEVNSQQYCEVFQSQHFPLLLAR